MSRVSLVLSSYFLLTFACATSSTTGAAAPTQSQSRAASAPAAAASKPTASDDDKLICEMERPVGSNIPKRVCRTQAQIDRERDAAQEKIRELSRTTNGRLE